MQALYERTLPRAQLWNGTHIPSSSNSLNSWHIKKISLWPITFHGRWECQTWKDQNLCLLLVDLSWAGIMCFHHFFQHLLTFNIFYWSLLRNSINISSAPSDETIDRLQFLQYFTFHSYPIQQYMTRFSISIYCNVDVKTVTKQRLGK